MSTMTPERLIDIVGHSTMLGANVRQSDGLVYLLTTCCQASGKGSLNSDTGVVCRACYAEVDMAYGDGAAVDDQLELDRFIARYDIVKEEEDMTNIDEDAVLAAAGETPLEAEQRHLDDAVSATGEKTDVLAAAVAVARAAGNDFRGMQKLVVELRKKIGMSRRWLSEEMHWTESRVWYLEQETTSETDQNFLDLMVMTTRVQELASGEWKKPTVRAAKASPAVTTVTVDVKAIVGTAVAEAVDVARKAYAEDLSVLTALVQSKLDAAKAKKTSVKPFAEIIEAIQAIQWSAK